MKNRIYKYLMHSYLRHLILLCLVVVVLVKPVSILFIGSTDVKYELYGDFEETEATEKEANKDFEQEEQSLFYTDLIQMTLNAYPTTDYFNLHKNTLDFSPGIHLPPPKI